jgi:hypothetical protein
MAQPTPSPSSGGPDWPTQVADRIESVVGLVRDKTTVPVVKGARWLVFAPILAAMALIIFVIAVIGLVRLHIFLPFEPEGRKLYVTYAALGAIFLLVGAFLWRKRRPGGDK